MCELLTNLKLTDWANVVQIIASFLATIFLFRTFNSQKKSALLSKQIAEMDKKAKRSDLLPEISGKIEVSYPYKNDQYGGARLLPFNGEYTTVKLKIEFNKNAVHINKFVLIETGKQIILQIEEIYFDKDTILLPGNNFEAKFKLNLLSYFDIDEKNVDENLSDVIEAGHPNYITDVKFNSKLFFNDMVGNQYELLLKINLAKVEISNLKMID